MIAGIEKTMPYLRWKLPVAKGRLGTLSRTHAVVHTVPMNFDCCLAIALWIALAGRPRVAGVLILQWAVGLRPSEAITLEGQMLTIPEQNPGGGGAQAAAVIALQPRKGTKSGRPQFVLLQEENCPEGMAVLRRMAATTPRGTRLSSITTTTELGRLIRKACLALSLPIFTAHSPRAGWATTQRLRGRPFLELMEDGRWESPSSLRRYLDAVTAISVDQATTHISPTAVWLRGDFFNRYCWWP